MKSKQQQQWKNKRRQNKRRQFVIRYWQLCREAFEMIDWKTIAGRRLVELARKELNYSPKTLSKVIFNSLRNDHHELKVKRAVKEVEAKANTETPKFNIFEKEGKVVYEDDIPRVPVDDPVYNSYNESGLERRIVVCVAVLMVLAVLWFMVMR